MASSMYGSSSDEERGEVRVLLLVAVEGAEVMVNPPALGMEGMCTSSH